MHDKDVPASRPALSSMTDLARLKEILDTFEREITVTFKEETYVVRDNGAVRRLPRPQGRQRSLDDVWSFGTLNRHSGYFEMVGHVVHRIVAIAFHGPPPSPGYVVDHIDTNRLNNRADNLRWVTRLENIILNPITRARIEVAFGSLDAFFDNPGAADVPNLEWMRVVTKEEAQASRSRLLAWAEQGKVGKGASLGDWLFKPAIRRDNIAVEEFEYRALAPPGAFRPTLLRAPSSARGQGDGPRSPDAQLTAHPDVTSRDTLSLTVGAFQRRWKTPAEFPQCPEEASSDAMSNYLGRLPVGAVFARDRYGESHVVEAAIGADGTLSVVCTIPSTIKGWSHARVFVEQGSFCHESGGSFFSLEGAMKSHCIAIGKPHDAYDRSIDDFS